MGRPAAQTTTTTRPPDASGEVTIEQIVNETASGGTFTATGSAICDAGEVSTLAFDNGETLWWYEDKYTCADGSGAFVLRVELPPVH